MAKTKKFVLAMGCVYLIGIAILYVLGEGLGAAYLTAPGGIPVFYLADLVPPNSRLESAVRSYIGNLVLLLAGASLNVAAGYLLFRLLQVRSWPSSDV